MSVPEEKKPLDSIRNESTNTTDGAPERPDIEPFQAGAIGAVIKVRKSRLYVLFKTYQRCCISPSPSTFMGAPFRVLELTSLPGDKLFLRYEGKGGTIRELVLSASDESEIDFP